MPSGCGPRTGTAFTRISSIRWRSVWLSWTAAGAVPSSWDGRRAPTIAACTAGLANVQATASCGRLTPRPVGETLQPLDHRQVAAEGLAGEGRALAAPVVGVEGHRRAHPARQQPAGQSARKPARRRRGGRTRAGSAPRSPCGTGGREAPGSPAALPPAAPASARRRSWTRRRGGSCPVRPGLRAPRRSPPAGHAGRASGPGRCRCSRSPSCAGWTPPLAEARRGWRRGARGRPPSAARPWWR
jgi:hypothetical protein